MKHPGAYVIGRHIGYHELRGGQGKDVRVVLVHGHNVSVPVGRVKVKTVSHRHQVPASVFALVDLNGRIVSENVSVDGELVIDQGEAMAHRQVCIAVEVFGNQFQLLD